MTKNNSLLFQYENHWPTDMGAWFPQDRKVILRGKEIFTDLKELRWMGMLLYGITGHLFDDNALKMFESIWVIGISYPEPRLWPNRIAALAGTVRSTGVLGVSSATAMCESEFFGNKANLKSPSQLLRIKKEVDNGGELKNVIRAEMKKHRGIAGFNRPVEPKQDERVPIFLERAKELGFANGEHIQLAFKIQDALLELRYRNNYLNASGFAAAFSLDQGLSPREHQLYLIQCFTAGMTPCYIDAQEKPEGAFFPLRCNRIKYEGSHQRRKWEDSSFPMNKCKV